MRVNKRKSFTVIVNSLASIVWLCAIISMPTQAKAADVKAGERNFYEVLDDVLGDFEYDLKNGNVIGLKDLSIRNIAVSENVPPSFKSHLELLLTERILKTTKARVVQCLPCKAKKTSMTGDQMSIVATDSNPVEMARIAKMSNISSFLDVSFTYQTSGMILSMYIIDPETGSVIWSRSYNSETARSSAFRRGVDYSQIDDARKQTEYVPMIQYRLGIDFIFEPNVTKQTSCLALAYRMVERYDNRSKEVGFELDYIRDAGTIIGAPSSNTVGNLWSGINLTLLFHHAWTFLGEEENYNKTRGSLSIGIGGTYAAGYLGGLLRLGYEWRLAKHYAVSTLVGYRPLSSAILSSTNTQPVAGVEYGVGVNLLF